jgi:UDP-GlcNAc:undecaprenyl-phosphate GlcNAc-1-phosphate transferase
MKPIENLDNGILILFASIVISTILSWVSLFIAPKINLMDDPRSADHKKHKNKIPITGGIVLFITVFIISIFTDLWNNPNIWAILVSSLIIFFLGLLDDYFHLKPLQKLFGQFFGASVLIFYGVQINIFNSPEFLNSSDTMINNWLNTGFTLFWVLALANAFNFIDSIDGIVVGLSGVSTLFFFIISLTTGQEELFLLCSVLLGICIGLYFFNSHPAKLFLGDSGAQTLGFILASIAIIYNPLRGGQSSTWFVPILIFYMPLFDLILVVLSRFKRNKKIYKASRDHTYHRLSAKGVSIHHSVLIIHGVSLAMSMIGYLCLNLSTLNANLIFFSSILIGIVAFIKLDKNYL